MKVYILAICILYLTATTFADVHFTDDFSSKFYLFAAKATNCIYIRFLTF